MNNSTQYAEGKYYNVDTANICTVGNETVQITHELVVDELPIDVGNIDVVTVDAFHRLHKLPISSLPGGNPFDQDLNTFNDIEHNKIGVNMDPNGGSALGILKLSNLSSPASNWGCRTHYYLNDYPLSAPETRPYMTINASRSFDQNFTFGSYWTGSAWVSSDDLDSFKIQRLSERLNFGVTVGNQTGGTPTVEKLPVFIKANSNIGLYVDGTEDGGLYMLGPDLTTSYTRLMVWDQPAGGKIKTLDPNELLELITLNPVGGSLGLNIVVQDEGPNLSIRGFVEADLNIKLLTTATDLTIGLETISSIPSETLMQYVVGTQNDNELIKKPYDEIFDQNLDPFSNVTFNNIFSNGIIQTDEITENTLNDGITFSSKVIAGALTADSGTNTTYITRNTGSDELQWKVRENTYGSLGITGNLIETVINTIDIWEPVILSGSSSPAKNTSITTTNITVNNTGVYTITYNASIFNAQIPARDYEMSVFINQSSTISASVMCITIVSQDERQILSSSFMANLTSNDEIGLYVRNRTNAQNLTVECCNLTVLSVLD